jgi:Holliday junction resolvasome RuvABC endonuclease subunit
LKEQIILGVDPGTSVTGYGLVKVVGKSIELIELGVIKTGKLDDHPIKLKKIFIFLLYFQRKTRAYYTTRQRPKGNTYYA